MALEFVTESLESDDTHDTLDLKTSIYSGTWTRVYRVIVHDTEAPVTSDRVRKAFRIQIGQQYNENEQYYTDVYATSIDCKHVGETRNNAFDITVQWTNLILDVSGGSPPPGPPEPGDENFGGVSLTVQEQTVQELLTKYPDGTPIVNTAGVPFEIPPTIDRKTSTFVMTRQERGNPFAKWKSYESKYGVVNDSLFWGFPAGTLRLTMSITQPSRGFSTVSYSFSYIVRGESGIVTETWNDSIKVLSTGRHELRETAPGTPKVPVQITDAVTGQIIPEPVPLDSAGLRVPLKDVNGFQVPDPAKLHWVNLNLFSTRNFAALRLPSPESFNV